VLASTYGLLAAGIEHLPQFPTYPNRMTAYEVSAGMTMPYAALAIMGNGGAIAILLMVFMAVTSAMSSETVATTALLTYNVYKAYINPNATGKQLLRFSNYVVPLFAIACSSIAIGFNHGGFSVGFLTTAIGIFVDSAIVPMACTVMWKKQSRVAAIISPLASSAAGFIAWFVTAYREYGVVSIASLSGNLPLVAGNMMALGGPLVLTPLITFIKPEDFDWERLKTEIKRGDDEVVTPSLAPTDTLPEDKSDGRVHDTEPALSTSAAHDAEDGHILLRARTRSIIASVFLTLSLLVLWPTPMYGSGYVFSKGFFKGWIVVVFLWAFFAAGTVTLLPVWEGRKSILELCAYVVGRKKEAGKGENVIEGVDVKHEEVGMGAITDREMN
jgi:Na+/proline symporter